MDESFSNQCRACAGSQEFSGEMISLFERNILEMFTHCTALEIAPNDSLPSRICIDCFGLLSKFNDFRQKCIDSDTLFREQIATDSIKVESLDETPIKCEDNEPNRDLESEFFETEYSDIFGKYDPDSITERLPTSTDAQNPIPDSNLFDDETFTCDYCHKVFDKKAYIRKHMRKHKNEMPLESRTIPCTVKGCHKFFATKRQIDNHARHVHKILKRANIKFSCTQCPKWFAVEHKLGAHIRRVHEGLKPYKCPHCVEDFCKYRTYVNHIRFNHSTVEYEMFQCSYEGCDKGYRLMDTLKCHIKRVHLGIKKVINRKYICEQCGRSFNNSFNLKSHSYSHSRDYPFHCKICPVKFASKNKLKIHEMRHRNEKPFECPTCGARKTTNKELQTHLNFHSKAISYPCKECDRVFTSNAAHCRHVRIHHRNHKPYICPHCQKAFAKAEVMKNHVMTHTGEKPFACPVCDHRFIQAVAMKTHMKVHAKKSKK